MGNIQIRANNILQVPPGLLYWFFPHVEKQEPKLRSAQMSAGSLSLGFLGAWLSGMQILFLEAFRSVKFLLLSHSAEELLWYKFKKATCKPHETTYIALR